MGDENPPTSLFLFVGLWRAGPKRELELRRGKGEEEEGVKRLPGACKPKCCSQGAQCWCCGVKPISSIRMGCWWAPRLPLLQPMGIYVLLGIRR